MLIKKKGEYVIGQSAKHVINQPKEYRICINTYMYIYCMYEYI